MISIIDAPFAKPDDTLQYIKDDEQVFSTGETLDIPEEPVTRHDGAVQFFHTVKTPMRDAAGTITGTIGVSQDISERKQADAWLAQSLASSPLITIEWDTHGIVRRWNRSAERVFGWSAEEALGKRVFELIAPYVAERQYASLIEQHLNGHIVNARFGNLTKDGRTVTCQWYNVVLRQAGQPIGMLAQAEDLTERLQAEQERLALQEQIIAAQDATLRELSTPLIPLGDNIVALPLVGGIDSQRAQQIIDSLLQGVAEQRPPRRSSTSRACRWWTRRWRIR